MAVATASFDASARTRAPSEGPPMRRNSTLFRRVSAQAMGMAPNSLCHKSHWVPKSTRPNCSNCKQSFRMFNAKHHCRLCGEVVCGTCSTKRILFQKKSVRSCDECVNHRVDTISRYNRRSNSSSSSSVDLNSSDEAALTTKHQSHLQRVLKRSSESDVRPMSSMDEAQPRSRGQSQPATRSSRTEVYKYRPVPRVESWRMQLPYLVMFFLMTVAGVTNVLALLR